MTTAPPTLIESDYAHRLVSIVDRLRDAARHALSTWTWLHRSDRRADEHPGAEAQRIVDGVRAEVPDSAALGRLAGEFGDRVAAHQLLQLQAKARTELGSELHIPDRLAPGVLAGFVHENVSLIKKLQGATLDHLETILTRAAAAGTSSDAIAKEIEARFGVSERHARLIARDQVAKLHSQVTEARCDEVGITHYFWRHTPQQHPRPHHVARDGKRFRFDSPPSDGRPGTQPCCKCLPDPDLTTIGDAALESAPGRGIGFERIIGEPPEPVAPGPAPVESPLERLARRKRELYGPGGYVHQPAPPRFQELSREADEERQRHERELRARLEKLRGQAPEPSAAPTEDFPFARVQRPGFMTRAVGALKRLVRLDEHGNVIEEPDYSDSIARWRENRRRTDRL